MAGKRNGKWQDGHYVTVYELAREGMTEKQIAATMGISLPTLARWKSQRPALRDAWDRGKGRTASEDRYSFREYVYQRLPADLRGLWDEIMACETEANDIARVEAMLTAHGKRARQHLFIYALTSSNFNISRAMQRLNIPRKTFEAWVANEPDFAELMAEIHWHKKNFFEDALIQRVQAGDTPAVIYAAKAQLRDRGYNDRVDVAVKQDVSITATSVAVNVDELGLPLDTRRQILEAMRQQPQQHTGGAIGHEATS
jgi:hypothetical protein